MRNFLFTLQAEIAISVKAETEIEAWLNINQLIPELPPNRCFQFSAENPTIGNILCTPSKESIKLLGKQLPSDNSDMGV